MEEQLIGWISWASAQWTLLSEQRELLSSAVVELIPRNALVPLLAIALVFWPIIVSFLYAVMTASTWIIWLFTSVMFGCLQLMYVTYQFIMITLDLGGLSVLKSYSMMRQQVLNFFDILGGGNGQYKSRRRQWREKLATAGTYENFLKIRIEPKKHHLTMGSNSHSVGGQQDHRHNSNSGASQSSMRENHGNGSKKHSGKSTANNSPMDSALPPRPPPRNKAGLSKATNSLLLHHQHQPQSPTPMVRSASFDNKSSPVSSPTNASRTNQSSSTSPTNMKKTHSLSSFSQLFSNETAASQATSLDESMRHAGVDPIVSDELGERTAYLLVTTTERLMDSRKQVEKHPGDKESWNRLLHLLSAVVKRNHLNLDDILVQNARSVSDSGQYGLTSQSRQTIRKFHEQVQKCLDLLADGPPATLAISSKTSTSAAGDTTSSQPSYSRTSNQQHLQLSERSSGTLSPDSSPRSSTSSINSEIIPDDNVELAERVRVMRRMKHNMGRTALMLSGGGAQAMYHLGIIRALIQSKIYHDIQVISGTSGGSIAAAMCALKTPEEMFQTVCVPRVSTDFTMDGEQKRQNIRWFPTIMEMASYWLKHKLLMDNHEFRRTCEFYYGDATFEEAFERTGKHVCITVSASRVSGDSAQRLLLNHISTPRVTLASAVAASCALPGVMAPAKLLTKNAVGELEPFEVDGVEWIDGSVQADLPFQRISTLFAVSNFIVSQTNFHIVPFLNKAHHPNQKSLYWKLFQTMEWDIRGRALKLSRLGLFPRIFGQDISKVFKQKYHGNLTLVPRFTTMQTFGLHALSNPTVKDMEGYIKYGEIAAWPYLNAIRDMIRLEKVLDDCLSRLEQRLGPALPDASWYDDGYSIASSSNVIGFSSTPRVKIISAGSVLSGSHRGGGESSTATKRKVKSLEEENRALKEQLLQLQKQLQANGVDAGHIKTS